MTQANVDSLLLYGKEQGPHGAAGHAPVHGTLRNPSLDVRMRGLNRDMLSLPFLCMLRGRHVWCLRTLLPCHPQ